MLENDGLEIDSVLLTHWHGDHTGGVAPLLSRYPQLRPSIYKNNPDQGQQPIANNQVFSVEGATLRALFTPGHAIDHMCFVLEEENALFTGDNVLGHGFPVIENLGIFMKSLELMGSRRCSTGFPAHGVVIPDLPGKIALCIKRYIRRENQVLDLLRTSRMKAQTSLQDDRKVKGSITVQELVNEIYGDVPEEFSAMALQPALNETLQKLADEGKVGFELEVEDWVARSSKYWFLLGKGW